MGSLTGSVEALEAEMGQICGKLKAPKETPKPTETQTENNVEGLKKDPDTTGDTTTTSTSLVNENVNENENQVPVNVNEEANANDAKDSVLVFGDGDPNIPSDNVIELVTQYLEKVDEEKEDVEEEKKPEEIKVAGDHKVEEKSKKDEELNNLKGPPTDMSEEKSNSKEEYTNTPQNSVVDPAPALINNEIPNVVVVDKIEKPQPGKQNDDSVLFFGDGHPNIPSDKVIDLVTEHLDKMDGDDDIPPIPPYPVVDKIEASKADIQNDDSVLIFVDGDPSLPSDKVTELVTKHLAKVDEEKEDGKIDPSFTVVEKADIR